MAKTSIKPEEATPVTSTAVTTTQSAAPANYNPDKYDDSSRDVQHPVLGLINKIGPLSKTFPKNAGEFAFADTILLGEKVTVIPLGFLKIFIESRRDGKDLKYGDGIIAKVFPSANAAYQAGYVVDFDSNMPNRVEEGSKLGFLVLGPKEDTTGEFYLRSPDGGNYGLAVTTLRRGGHKGVYRPLYNHYYRRAKAAGLPESEIHTLLEKPDFSWTLSAEHVDNPARGQDWFEPRIARAAQLTPEFAAWVTAEVGKFTL